MSAKKVDRSAHEPSWAEVILGAVLSAGLGIVLGGVLLAIKPLAPVKEMPKQPLSGVIYYIQGSRDNAKAKQAEAKRKQFAQGASVTASEDEINSLLPPPPPLWNAPGAKPKEADKKGAEKAKAPDKAGKAGEKGAAPAAPASSGDLITLGGPNFHFHDGKIQIAVPVTVSVLGLDQMITVLADGNFANQGGAFTFNPDTVYFGSCPMDRLPFASGVVVKKFIAAVPVPQDIAAVWPKVTGVTVEGNALKVAMP